MRGAWRAVAATMAALAVAACFSERPDDPTGPGGDAVVVEMTDQLTFSPRTATARRGQDVLWRSVSAFVHTATGDPAKARDVANVTLPAGADPWDSGGIAADGAFRMAFGVAGTYAYVCLPHEAQGMVGTLVVTP